MATQRGQLSTYARIAAVIRSRIVAGEYGGTGSRVPSEPEIIDLIGVSKTNASEALRLLEAEGVITRRTGVGSFVADIPELEEVPAAPGSRIIARPAVDAAEAGGDTCVLVLAEPGRPARVLPGGRTVIVVG